MAIVNLGLTKQETRWCCGLAGIELFGKVKIYWLILFDNPILIVFHIDHTGVASSFPLSGLYFVILSMTIIGHTGQY